MGKTSIEWTDVTWNPTRGCSRVSEGCRNCYAERIAARFSDCWSIEDGKIDEHKACNGLPPKHHPAPFHGFATMTPSGPRWTGKVEVVEDKLDEPLHWRKPRRIFVNSMSDLFHEALPDEAIDRVFAVMALCPQHTFQCLTKRPKRMWQWFNGLTTERMVDGIWAAPSSVRGYSGGWPLPNVWLGVSVEDQATADGRIPFLLETPAAIRFISYEPALGPLDHLGTSFLSARRCAYCGHSCRCGCPCPSTLDHREKLDWVIAGEETGPGSRVANPGWFRIVRDQCAEAGVPFFFKQWGGRTRNRELDGQEHNEFPENETTGD